MTRTKTTNMFQRPGWVAFFALTAAVAWGWAYPLIKLGFEYWGITPDMTGGKMLFAGVRFSLAGLVVLAIARASHKSLRVKTSFGLAYVIFFALLNTTLHYTFFYIGMSHSPGARAAILNSSGTFLLVILACLFFKTDRLTFAKVLGCVLGLGGLMALNANGGTRSEFTMSGDGMILLNACCAAFAGLMTRGLGKQTDIMVGTGYSLAIGGVLLVIPGLMLGGTLPQVTVAGIIVLVLLIAISALGFSLYNKLLTCNPVGKVAIYNSLIPVVGALTSCLCLAEPFQWRYLIAALLAAAGIYVINRDKV